MNTKSKPARVNFRLLLGIGIGLCALVPAVYFIRQYQQNQLVQAALQDGNAAFEKGDWNAAAQGLGRYLGRNQEDVAVLLKYAQAQRRIQPFQATNLAQATSAYRRILRIDPANEEALQQVAILYRLSGQFDELARLAKLRQDGGSADPLLTIWLATSAAAKGRFDDPEIQNLAEKIDRDAGELSASAYAEACVLLAQIALTNPVGSEAERTERALKELEKAITRDPGAAEPRIVLAAILRERSKTATGEAQVKLRQEARAALEQAEKLEIANPRLGMVLSQEWIEWREFDRATAQVERLRKLSPQELEPFFLSFEEWQAQLFVQRAKLALLTDKAEALVDEAITLLKPEVMSEAGARLAMLPAAVELFVITKRQADPGKEVLPAREALNEYTERLKLLDQLKAQPERLAVLTAMVLREEKEYRKVIDTLQPIISKIENDAFPRRMLAEAYQQIGDSAKAAAVLESLVGTAGADPGVLRAVAVAQSRRGEWDKVIETAKLGEADAADPIDFSVIRLQAQLSKLAGLPPPQRRAGLAAINTETATLTASHPKRADLRLLTAFAAELADKKDEALQALKQALVDLPDERGLAIQLAQFHLRAGDRAAAIAALRDETSRRPDSLGAWRFLAGLLAADGDRPAAIATLEQALLTAPNEARSKLIVDLAGLEVAEGNEPAAIARLEQLLNDKPDAIEARAFLLSLPVVANDGPRAKKLIADLRAIVEKSPDSEDNVQWPLLEAEWLRRLANWKEQSPRIIELLKECLKAAPDAEAPALMLGDLYQRLRKDDDAERTYREFLARNPSAEITNRLVVMLVNQDRANEARDLVNQFESGINAGALTGGRLALALESKDYSSALDEVAERMRRSGDNAADLIYMANLDYLANKSVEEAMKKLGAAADLGGNPLEIARARANILRMAGRIPEALKILDGLVAQEASFEARYLRATFLDEVGDRERALEDYAALPGLTDAGLGYAIYGEALAQRGRLGEAIDEWEKGLIADPANPGLTRGLVKARLTRNQPGDREKADELLTSHRKAPELPGRIPADEDPELQWIQAVYLRSDPAYMETTHKTELMVLLNKAAQLGPGNEETQIGLIRLARDQGDLKLAREFAESGLKVMRRSVALWTARAELELALGNPDAAWSAAQSALNADGLFAPAWAVLAESAINAPPAERESRLRAAERRFGEARLTGSESELLKIQLARLLAAADRPNDAIKVLEEVRAAPTATNKVPALLFLVDLYRQTGDHAASAARLAEVESLAADNPALVANRVLNWIAERKFDAVAEWAKSAELDEANQRALFLAAEKLTAEGGPAYIGIAREIFERTAKRWPNDAPPKMGLAGLAYQEGKIDDAERLYRKAIDVDSKASSALNNLAWLLAAERGNFSEAEGFSRRAISLVPNDPEYRDTLGFILMKQKPPKLPEARTQFEQCVALSPPNSGVRARALLKLADVLNQLRETSRARGILDEASAIEQKSPTFTAEEKREIGRLEQELRGNP